MRREHFHKNGKSLPSWKVLWMILKAWIHVLVTQGDFLRLSCHLMLQAWHFWSEVGKASQASAELTDTVFSIKACIMSLVPFSKAVPNSTSWLHNGAWLCGSDWAHNEPKEAVLVFQVPLFKMWHHTVAEEHSKPLCKTWRRLGGLPGCLSEFKC